LNNPQLITTSIEKRRDEANNMDILESELQQVQRQLKELDRQQKQLLQWALKGFPEEQIVAENKRINKATSIPKMEEYIRLVQEKLTTLDFDMKRLALDMLNIKVWFDGQSVEVTGTIPVEDADVVTTSS